MYNVGSDDQGVIGVKIYDQQEGEYRFREGVKDAVQKGQNESHEDEEMAEAIIEKDKMENEAGLLYGHGRTGFSNTWGQNDNDNNLDRDVEPVPASGPRRLFSVSASDNVSQTSADTFVTPCPKLAKRDCMFERCSVEDDDDPEDSD